MWNLPICPAEVLWQGAVLNDTTPIFLVDAGRKLQLLIVYGRVHVCVCSFVLDFFNAGCD